jgi:hypothetical protein
MYPNAQGLTETSRSQGVRVQEQIGGDGGDQVGGLDGDHREMEPNGEGGGKELPDGGRQGQEVGGTGHQGNVIKAGAVVGTAKLFMDIMAVKLETLREHCEEKGISLKQPCIPTLSGRIGMKR